MITTILKSLSEIRRRHGYVLPESAQFESRQLTLELVDLGYWPPTGNLAHPSPAYRMWENYGPDWHMYREPHNCRHCGEDLRDLDNGPPFKREIAFVSNDRLQYYTCPKCGKVL